MPRSVDEIPEGLSRYGKAARNRHIDADHFNRGLRPSLQQWQGPPCQPLPAKTTASISNSPPGEPSLPNHPAITIYQGFTGYIGYIQKDNIRASILPHLLCSRRFMRAMEALEALMGIIQPVQCQESIPVQDSVGRVLSVDIVSAVDLPEFKPRGHGRIRRSDSSDARGASTTNPVYLHLDENCTQVRTGMVVPETSTPWSWLEETFCAETRSGHGRSSSISKRLPIGGGHRRGDLISRRENKIRPPDIAYTWLPWE